MSDATIRGMNESVLNHFGIDMQLDKMEEELAELLLSTKRVRSGKIDITSYPFLEEIADVENMLQQIKIEIQRDIVSNAIGHITDIDSELDLIKREKLEKVIGREKVEK